MKKFAILTLVCLSGQAAIGAEKARPLLKDFIGINGHFTFKPDLYSQVCRLARNYHNMAWDVNRPGDGPTFPWCVNKVNWKDHVYGRWTGAGVEVDICTSLAASGQKTRHTGHCGKARNPGPTPMAMKWPGTSAHQEASGCVPP